MSTEVINGLTYDDGKLRNSTLNIAQLTLWQYIIHFDKFGIVSDVAHAMRETLPNVGMFLLSILIILLFPISVPGITLIRAIFATRDARRQVRREQAIGKHKDIRLPGDGWREN